MTARARAVAAIGAYLCLATQLVGLLHVLLVRHATCPDHGEIVHGAAPVAAHASVLAELAIAPAPADTADDEDEHCLFVATRRRENAGLAPAAQPVARIEASAATSLRAPPRLLIVAPTLYRIAPKTSPPSAAV
jgi:hypothetical protein